MLLTLTLALTYFSFKKSTAEAKYFDYYLWYGTGTLNRKRKAGIVLFCRDLKAWLNLLLQFSTIRLCHYAC
jgi:hypothetical protein